MDPIAARAGGVMPFLLLGLACGVLMSTPLVRAAHRASILTRLPRRERLDAIGATRAATRSIPGLAAVHVVVVGAVARRRAHRERAALEREIPAVVDLLQVAVGAGSSPLRALEVAARWGPRRSGEALRGVLAGARLGEPLVDALQRLGARRPELAPLAEVMIATEQLGTPAGPALGRVADEVRADLRRRAEARARVLPVKLLFPLVFLVLPAFGLLTVVPTLLSALTHL